VQSLQTQLHPCITGDGVAGSVTEVLGHHRWQWAGACHDMRCLPLFDSVLSKLVARLRCLMGKS
jgi:hypothetical protein